MMSLSGPRLAAEKRISLSAWPGLFQGSTKGGSDEYMAWYSTE